MIEEDIAKFVVENAKNENAKNEKYQNDAQQYLVAVLSEWKVHDSVLRERLWNIVLSFVMSLGCDAVFDYLSM